MNMSRTKRKRKLVEWLESCQENQVRVLDEKIPLLSFAVDFVTCLLYTSTERYVRNSTADFLVFKQDYKI